MNVCSIQNDVEFIIFLSYVGTWYNIQISYISALLQKFYENIFKSNFYIFLDFQVDYRSSIMILAYRLAFP